MADRHRRHKLSTREGPDKAIFGLGTTASALRPFIWRITFRNPPFPVLLHSMSYQRVSCRQLCVTEPTVDLAAQSKYHCFRAHIMGFVWLTLIPQWSANGRAGKPST